MIRNQLICHINFLIKLGFVGEMNIDGEPVGRGLAPAATKDLTQQNGGSKPPPYNEIAHSTVRQTQI